MSELPWRRLTLPAFHRQGAETGSAFIEHVHSNIWHRHLDAGFRLAQLLFFRAAEYFHQHVAVQHVS